MHYFSLFSTEFKKPALIFRAFGRKIVLGNFEKILKFFYKNSLLKWNFYLFLEVLLKIEPSEITSFFQQFFQFRGGDVPCVPPGGAYVIQSNKSRRVRSEQRNNLRSVQYATICPLVITIGRGGARIFPRRISRPLKGYHAAPAVIGWTPAPRMEAKFHFFKRFKVLENESIFQKYPDYSCPQINFYKKNLEKLNKFNKDF